MWKIRCGLGRKASLPFPLLLRIIWPGLDLGGHGSARFGDTVFSASFAALKRGKWVSGKNEPSLKNEMNQSATTSDHLKTFYDQWLILSKYWLCRAATQFLFFAERRWGYFPVLSVVSSLLQLAGPLAAVASLCRTPDMRLSRGGRLRCRLLIFLWQLLPPALGGEKNNKHNLSAIHSDLKFTGRLLVLNVKIMLLLKFPSVGHKRLIVIVM